jgi:hypothetical protein
MSWRGGAVVTPVPGGPFGTEFRPHAKRISAAGLVLGERINEAVDYSTSVSAPPGVPSERWDRQICDLIQRLVDAEHHAVTLAANGSASSLEWMADKLSEPNTGDGPMKNLATELRELASEANSVLGRIWLSMGDDSGAHPGHEELRPEVWEFKENLVEAAHWIADQIDERQRQQGSVGQART